MRRTRRIVLCLLAAIATLFAANETPKRPRLVVAIVIDQFRYDYLLRFRNDYTSGFKRLLEQGAVFHDAHLIHSATVTAVGHSTFLSGATPSVSGIISNEWYDRASHQMVTSVFDPKSKMVGGVPGAPGSSPRRLLVSTVGDELKMHGIESKIIGVSIKDRSAILPAGHMADGAYWYDPDSNHWVTSTYYRAELPDWVREMNSEQIYQRYLGANWLPLDAPNGGTKPFCTMAAGTDVRFCGGLEATPWGNEMIEEFAERAVSNEKLGSHSGTDILAVSFSSNDYVGHAVGPDDPAVRDISIRTDRLLGKLLDFIDARVGKGNSIVVLTADHGVAPVPEVNEARNMPGGRLSEPHLGQDISDALVKRFGPGKWLLPAPATTPYLNLDLIQSRRLDPAEVERVAARAAASEEHIARVYTRHEVLSGEVQRDEIGRAVSLGFYGPRSGDLVILQEPYYLFEATGTSHGTPYDYDNHIPVIFFGLGIKPGAYWKKIAMNDIAPTLSALLGIEAPSGSIGRVLTELLP
ncbi:MAG TPA: alkaline phosphatase family protein [Bryobacteraceae bacterium]|nr:alkaline phosphatase family protein [Bryobacteraceae bacterium]